MVIVGTGIAGATAAETLRAEGFSGRIVMVGDEPSLPYRRPALSKDLLAGTMTAERALLKSDTAWTEKDIDIRSGISAETIDPERRTVALSDGETLTFEALLLATGGRAREFATRSGERIHTLRGLADTTSLRDAIIGAGSVLIVGGGLIGSEVAATARSLGTEVTILEAAEAPLIRILPPAISKMYRQLHAEHGVTMETGVSLTSLTLDDHGVVATDTEGRTWSAGMALVAIGMAPNTELAASARLSIDNGIVVDEHFRTSASGIYAAGDVANCPNPIIGGRHRTEHWNSAMSQGAAAAKAMLGRPALFTEVPWAWSTQYGHNLQFAGWPRADDDLIVRGSLDDRNFTALFSRNRMLVGAVSMGRPKDIRAARELIQHRSPLDQQALRDEDTSLADLAAIRRETAPRSVAPIDSVHG
ncbi:MULTISPECIES: NAD(P)/FAD-dependent oxidoreductase [Rhodococcus]|uniref:NAD(P)/FAD-dependent oxidoreductase n=1 Tax=Rhodococcus TaxID=1827 RepID=UPI0029537A12|nr:MULTISPECIES: FAD-dependent oxidoreductase [Rhodococcus]MDV7246585.1 FAD-dependent oxidoreductase [Rhodococcus oxybenzonivorans]MDV7337597.1 FAD-dependent oxidoreductase [Rhodococcus oxybenzonivorans]MDV8031393.1 FAD-dependent oxidoreductase [Rhodococcus sp. IEGM 27]